MLVGDALSTRTPEWKGLLHSLFQRHKRIPWHHGHLPLVRHAKEQGALHKQTQALGSL